MKKYYAFITETIIYRVELSAKNEKEILNKFYEGEIDYSSEDIWEVPEEEILIVENDL